MDTVLTLSLCIIAGKALLDAWIQRHYWLPQKRHEVDLVDDLDAPSIGGQAPQSEVDFVAKIFETVKANPTFGPIFDRLLEDINDRPTTRQVVATAFACELINREGYNDGTVPAAFDMADAFLRVAKAPVQQVHADIAAGEPAVVDAGQSGAAGTVTVLDQ